VSTIEARGGRLETRAGAAASVAALFVTTVGDEVALVALMLRLAHGSSPGLAVAALLMAGLLPAVLFSPLTGALVDARDARAVAAGALALQAAIVTAMSFVSSPAGIVALALALGSLTAFVVPAVFALIPAAVGRSGWAKANALVSGSASLGSFAGPALGGIVVAAAGTRTALLLDAASFVFAAVVLRLAAPTRPPLEARGQRRKVAFAADGLRALLCDPLLRLTLPILLGGVIASSMTNVALVFFVRGPLHGGSIAFGALVAAWGLGIVAGPLLGLRMFAPRTLPYVPIAATLAIGAALVAAAASASITAAAVAFVVGGAANGIQNVAMRTLLHMRMPEHLHGRVYSAYFGVASAAVVTGFLISGAVAPGASRATLLVAGAVTVVLGTVGTATVLRTVVAPASARDSRAA
jgi:MFS family permease